MNLPYVGRAAEMRGLHRALEEARRGQTVAVFVSGEAGVGKSRLISEFAAEIAGGGVIELTGTCLDVGEDAPLWPVADVLGRLLRGRQSAATIELLRPWWGQLKRLLPMLATPVSPTPTPTPTSWPASPAPPDALSGAANSPAAAWEASGERQHVSTLVEVLLQVVIALAGRRPVVLCLEDLQWADRSTRNLLVFLLANLSAEPVLVICSYRPDALGGTHPLRKLLPELRRNRRSRWVELRPLQRGDVDQLVAATLGGDARDQATELVWSRGEGHPLYTEEFLHALTHGDVTEVPQTLRELLLNQVALLPLEARQVVRAAALGFEPLSHDILATVVDLPEEALLAAIRAAVDGLVLSPDPASAGYRLRHGFFREVVESELLPGERAVLHRRHAQALERRPEKGHAYLARLAHHWQRSGDAQRALVALIAAAEEAERFYGFAEAFHHWTAAVALCDAVPGGRPKAALIERAAQTAHLSGNHDDAVRLLCAPLDALPAAAVEERRQLLSRRGGYLLAAGRVREAVAEYEQAAALPIAGRADEEAQAAVLGGLAEALLMAGRYADARAVARQALAMGQGVASPARAAPALITLGVSKAYLEDHAAGVADLRKSLDIADRGRHPEDLGRAFVHLAEVLAGPVNQPDEGVAIAREGARVVTDLGIGRTFGVRLLAIAANGLFRLGRWDEAEQVVNDALARKPTGPDAIDARLARCRLLVGRGRLDLAAMDLEALDALTAEAVGPRFRGPLLTLRAGLAMWQRRYDEARQAVESGVGAATTDSDDVWLLAPLVWHGLRVEAEAAARGLSAPSVTAARVERLRRYVAQMTERTPASPAVRRTVRGYVALCEGELSRIAGRSESRAWASAAAVWQRERHPYPAAYALLQEAEALFGERTRNAHAAERLRAAAALARQLGAQPLLEECAALAARARVRLDEDHTTADSESAAAVVTAIGPGAAVPGAASSGRTAEQYLARSPVSSLTPREMDVLKLLVHGHSNREIGKRLFISEKTVSVHVSRILAKLGVRTRVQATAYYVRSH
ncbi:MAG: helix-turn-helix transcriptional regulator [Frankiaceae bacterium]